MMAHSYTLRTAAMFIPMQSDLLRYYKVNGMDSTRQIIISGPTRYLKQVRQNMHGLITPLLWEWVVSSREEKLLIAYLRLSKCWQIIVSWWRSWFDATIFFCRLSYI